MPPYSLGFIMKSLRISCQLFLYHTTGWQLIDGKWYYFNPVAPTATWNYDEATGGWTYNGSTSRPYGSMYQNEMTPDGYWVDENGAWVQ